MKFLSLVLLCAAMAAGQTTGILKTTQNCRKELASDGCNICTICDGGLTTCTAMACLKSPSFVDPTPPPPRSVPAVRKTRSSCSVVGTFINTAVPTSCHDEQYWTCDDPSIPGGADRALLVSENQKKAMCLLVE